ncbi:MAG: glycosyltransferase [Candidatus Eremiobacteraeota bacterium]|nr:glycosyltransferase [Candidatus Eremiobacteraeota bacterium]
MEKVSILYFIGTLGRGGAEGQLLELIEGLDRERFSPGLVVLKGEDDLLDRCLAKGISPHFLRIGGLGDILNPLRLLKVLGNILALARKIKRERIQVLHGYLYTANVLAAFMGHLTGVPLVITSRRSLSTSKTRTWTPLHRLFEIIANSWTHLVIANSQAVREDTIKKEKLDPSKVMVIHNGVALDKYGQGPGARQEGLIPAGTAGVIGIVANLIPYKNHEMLLRALPLIKKEVQPLCLLCIGRDSGIQKDLERLAENLGVAGDIAWLGPRPDVHAILPLLDISVLVSNEEGFPNAVLESMAAGVPVVATAVGGVPELILEGETGYMVAPGDHEALASRVTGLLNDEKKRREMGEKSRERVKAHFSREKMVSVTEEVYLSWLRHGLPARSHRRGVPVEEV